MIKTFRLLTTRSSFIHSSAVHEKHLKRPYLLYSGPSHQRGIGERTAAQPALSEERMTVSRAVDGLQPANVWGFFEQLTKIPRPSKHEEKYV
jgi:hypothetical protein